MGNIVRSHRIHLLHLDVMALVSLNACATILPPNGQNINILIENAGVMARQEGHTADGPDIQPRN